MRKTMIAVAIALTATSSLPAFAASRTTPRAHQVEQGTVVHNHGASVRARGAYAQERFSPYSARASVNNARPHEPLYFQYATGAESM